MKKLFTVIAVLFLMFTLSAKTVMVDKESSGTEISAAEAIEKIAQMKEEPRILYKGEGCVWVAKDDITIKTDDAEVKAVLIEKFAKDDMWTANANKADKTTSEIIIAKVVGNWIVKYERHKFNKSDYSKYPINALKAIAKEKRLTVATEVIPTKEDYKRYNGKYILPAGTEQMIYWY